jgi:hypothetical protein
MELSDYKTRYYKLNNRAKISIKPILEYTYIKGYKLKLYYKLKSKITKRYIWIRVKSINIDNIIDIESSDFKNNLKSLLNRKSNEIIKFNKDILLLKKSIKNTYYERF